MPAASRTLGGPNPHDSSFLRTKQQLDKEPARPKPMTEADFYFMSRMDGDIEERRRAAFICELRKDPRFRPEMLEPPKSKFKTVTLEGGPIIKSHKPNKTGRETNRPYKWGPLGGW